MALTLSYNVRHLLARPLTTTLTVFGVSLVIFVFTATLMLQDGLQKTLTSTGNPNNLIIVRAGSQNEVQSSLSREQEGIIRTVSGFAEDERQHLMYTSDILVLLSLKKRSNGEPSNVNIRGVLPDAYRLRSSVSLVEGRLPTPGTQEVVVGTAIQKRFQNTEIGQKLRMVGTEWPIVGIIDAGTTAFSSEVWGDVNVMLPAFRRDGFSSLLFRLRSDTTPEKLQTEFDKDPRLNVSALRETEFFGKQASVMAIFIGILGKFVTVIYSIAAIIGCVITLYAAVAQRTREIGILRALGFKRSAILISFITEGLILSLIGGGIGIALASLLTFTQFSTTNFRTFSDLTFGFTLTKETCFYSLLFALVIGIISALLPAFRASRTQILTALRRA